MYKMHFTQTLCYNFNLTHTHMLVSIHVLSSNTQKQVWERNKIPKSFTQLSKNWYFQYLWIFGDENTHNMNYIDSL
jgi:hypothetical protein